MYVVSCMYACTIHYMIDILIYVAHRQVMYFSLDPKITPLGKTIYHSNLKGRKQLDSDRVSNI